jgi:alcohol dehydrogenase class IV
MAANVRALQHAGGAALSRYTEIGRLLTGKPGATADDGVAWVQALVEALEIPRLAAYGVTVRDLPVLVDKAAVASSMQANPMTLTAAQMHEILTEAL